VPKVYSEQEAEQGSSEWMRLHLGRPTASGFADFMTNSFEPRTGEMPKTYLAKKLAEVTWGPLPGFTSRATEQGIVMEEEAIPFFEMEFDLETYRVGFVVGDDGRCGCSPDALIGEDSGLEIKCPNPETHIKYLLNGTLPNEYWCQVYGSLYVTGRAEWHFLSYCRKLPPFHLVIKRDEQWMDKIGQCLARFYRDFDAALERIKPQKLAA